MQIAEGNAAHLSKKLLCTFLHLGAEDDELAIFCQQNLSIYKMKHSHCTKSVLGVRLFSAREFFALVIISWKLEFS